MDTKFENFRVDGRMDLLLTVNNIPSIFIKSCRSDVPYIYGVYGWTWNPRRSTYIRCISAALRRRSERGFCIRTLSRKIYFRPLWSLKVAPPPHHGAESAKKSCRARNASLLRKLKHRLVHWGLQLWLSQIQRTGVRQWTWRHEKRRTDIFREPPVTLMISDVGFHGWSWNYHRYTSIRCISSVARNRRRNYWLHSWIKRSGGFTNGARKYDTFNRLKRKDLNKPIIILEESFTD